MAARKKTPAKKKRSAAVSARAAENSPLVQYLVVTFTFLSIVYVAMAYWRYG